MKKVTCLKEAQKREALREIKTRQIKGWEDLGNGMVLKNWIKYSTKCSFISQCEIW